MSGNTACYVCLELVMEFKRANTGEIIIAALLVIIVVLLAVVLLSIPRPHTCGRCGARAVAATHRWSVGVAPGGGAGS